MKIKPFRIKKMISTKSKRGSAKIYDSYCSFKSLSVAQKTLSSCFLESKWVHKKTSDSQEGEKMWYYCKEKKCPVVCQLILSRDSLTRVSLLLSDDQHSHEQDEGTSSQLIQHGIDPNSKSKINELIQLGCKPGKILIELRKCQLSVPTTTQLYNYCKYFRKDKLGATTISLNDLKAWAEARLNNI